MPQSLSDFSLSRVWDRSIELVMANIRLLAIIAGVFMLIPTLVMYLAVPDLATMAAMQPEPGADPEELFEQMGEMYAGIAPFAFVGSILSIIGYSAMVALMGESGVTVGEAIVRGAKSILTVFAVSILFFLAYMLGAIVVFLPLALLGILGEAFAVIGGILGVFAILGVMMFLIGRFSVVLPVIILEKNLNPIAAISRSWRLTAPKQWPLTGFWTLLFVVYMVISLMVTGVLGVGAAMASGATSALIMGLSTGLLGVVVAMIISGILVALYQGLSGATAESMSETFE